MLARITPTPAGGIARPARSLTTLHARLDAEIAEIRRSVETAPYPADPILGSHSRITSMAAAYVRRHGMLAASCIGHAIDLLSDGRLEVVPEYEVPLTRVAYDIVRANARGRTMDIDLPEGAPFTETYRVDLLVVSEELGVAWLVEVKRINAEQYQRKLRAPLRKLEVARLSASAMLRGAYRVSRVEPLLVSLYGTSPSPEILDRANLDRFFGLPIEVELDRLDERYRAEVTASLQTRLAADFAGFGSGTACAREPDGPIDAAVRDPVSQLVTPAQLFAGRRPAPVAASPVSERAAPRFMGAA